jgi:hypothetical protein
VVVTLSEARPDTVLELYETWARRDRETAAGAELDWREREEDIIERDFEVLERPEGGRTFLVLRLDIV